VRKRKDTPKKKGQAAIAIEVRGASGKNTFPDGSFPFERRKRAQKEETSGKN